MLLMCCLHIYKVLPVGTVWLLYWCHFLRVWLHEWEVLSLVTKYNLDTVIKHCFIHGRMLETKILGCSFPLSILKNKLWKTGQRAHKSFITYRNLDSLEWEFSAKYLSWTVSCSIIFQGILIKILLNALKLIYICLN